MFLFYIKIFSPESRIVPRLKDHWRLSRWQANFTGVCSLSKVEICRQNIPPECSRDVNQVFVGIDCSVGNAHDAIMAHVERKAKYYEKYLELEEPVIHCSRIGQLWEGVKVSGKYCSCPCNIW